MNFLRTLAILLLLFTGTGAIFGGWSLMRDPTGADLKIPLTYLQHSPFEDYFIPGIILFTINGIFSIVAMVWTIFRWRNYFWVMMIQGGLLTGWIIVQMILLRQIYYLQFIFGGIGLVLIIIGFVLKKKNT